jgi:hypothetical protein
MRIEPHRNLTVTLIRRNQFSTLRYAASVPRRPIAQVMHLAQRLKVCPPGSATAALAEGLRQDQAPQAWPYDCPQPTGLRRLPEGQPLQSPPSAADNPHIPTPLPQIQSLRATLADAKPSRLDVLA